MLTRRSFTATAAAFVAAPALAAKPLDPGEYILGIDNYGYPDDPTMKWFQEQNARRFTGVYLTHWNPNDNRIRKDVGWIEKRDFLNKRGWGFLPTYMGLQPPGAAGPKFPTFPMPTEDEGTTLGQQAVALMKEAGFQKGSIVYLDIETPIQESGAYMKYVRAWQRSVAKGNYYPGIYCSHTITKWMKKYTDAIWEFEVPEGSTIARVLDLVFIQNYDPSKFPYGQIHDGAIATQYLQNSPIPGCPKTDKFDSNSSLVPDPSDLAAVLEVLGKKSADLNKFFD